MKTEEIEIEEIDQTDVIKTEKAKIEENDEPMKVDIIPMNGMQVINIPINGKITIINPLEFQSSSNSLGSEKQDQPIDAQ